MLRSGGLRWSQVTELTFIWRFFQVSTLCDFKSGYFHFPAALWKCSLSRLPTETFPFISYVEHSELWWLFTNTLNLYCVLQRNGPWPKINLSNTWTCAWLWWTERPALSSSCKAVEKTTADRWVHTSLRHSSHNLALWMCGGTPVNILSLFY